MVRPIQRGLNYFPLDVTFNQDDKIALIEADLYWELISQDIYNNFIILTSRGIHKRYFEAADRRKEVQIIKEHVQLTELEHVRHTTYDHSFTQQNKPQTFHRTETLPNWASSDYLVKDELVDEETIRSNKEMLERIRSKRK